ncbi:MAG TPA: ferritin-like domain-containing protein [Saprospiraceae bacterium]|nr:ferritin-like domain-containing protein [Saprospiraceae bacterium]
MKDLRELLAHEVQDLYSAETQLIQAFPKLSGVTQSNRLKQTFDKHLEETKRQKERLQQIAKLMQIKVNDGKCEGMEGLLRESEKFTKVKVEPEVRDAAIIGAAQKIEHYQIAGYGTARTYAQLIGESEIADLLGYCLNEVKTADQTLTNVALERVNERAMA